MQIGIRDDRINGKVEHDRLCETDRSSIATAGWSSELSSLR